MKDDPGDAENRNERIATIAPRLPEAVGRERHGFQHNLQLALFSALQSTVTSMAKSPQQIAEAIVRPSSVVPRRSSSCGDRGLEKRHQNRRLGKLPYLDGPRNDECHGVDDDERGEELLERPAQRQLVQATAYTGRLARL